MLAVLPAHILVSDVEVPLDANAVEVPLDPGVAETLLALSSGEVSLDPGIVVTSSAGGGNGDDETMEAAERAKTSEERTERIVLRMSGLKDREA